MEQLSEEEITRLRTLLEEDQLRKLRILYSQLMDARRIDELAALFTEDGVCEFGPYGRWEGRDTIRENFAQVDRDHGSPYYAVHNTCDHWVELTGSNTAVGRAYLIDVVTDRAPSENPIVVIGVYDDAYRKIATDWKIERCSLQFLWPHNQLTEGFPGPFPPT